MTAPALSVVLVTDRFETIRGVLEALGKQTARDSLEVVAVMPPGEYPKVDRALTERCGSFRIVSVESVMPMPRSRAAGVRACTAPVIFIGETHSYPHPEFAAELIAAHEGPWDIVVPGLDNANPSGPRSWSSFLLDYGYWLSGLPASEVSSGPTWNASYKRHVLMELDGILDGALSNSDQLPMELKARNRKFYFAPGAKISHVNLEDRGWMDERYLSGLVVGSNRAKRWSAFRRGAYVFASPLIPFVLVYRNVQSLRNLYGRSKLPPGSAAAVILGSVVRTVGEVVGYLRGIGPHQEARMEEYELNKVMYVKRVVSWDELA